MPKLTAHQLQTLKAQADQLAARARGDETTLLGALAGLQTPETAALLTRHKEAVIIALQTAIDNAFSGDFTAAKTTAQGPHTARLHTPKDTDQLGANFKIGSRQLGLALEAILGDASETMIERNIIRSRMVLAYDHLANETMAAARALPQGRSRT